MVSLETYRETERKLRSYFKAKCKLDHVEAIIKALEGERGRLRALLAVGIKLRPSYPNPSYSPVPVDPGATSPIERSLDLAEEQRERMEARLLEIADRLVELELERGRLREETAGMQALLDNLSPDDMSLIRQRYDEGLSYQQIAYRMQGTSRSAIHRRLRDIVCELARSIGWDESGKKVG